MMRCVFGMVFFAQSSLYSFFAFGSAVVHQRYGFDPVTSGRLMSLFGLGQLLCPLCGLLVDRIPQHQYKVIVICNLLYAICFFILGFDLPDRSIAIVIMAMITLIYSF